VSGIYDSQFQSIHLQAFESLVGEAFFCESCKPCRCQTSTTFNRKFNAGQAGIEIDSSLAVRQPPAWGHPFLAANPCMHIRLNVQAIQPCLHLVSRKICD